MSRLQLEGEVVSTHDDLAEERHRSARLEDDLAVTRRELAKARGELAASKEAIENIRSSLSPLYRSLRLLFGDIEAVIGNDSPAPQTRSLKVWQSWMQKLPGMPAKFIEALLEHGEMSVAQIRVAAHCGQQTVYDVTSKLHKLGLLNKNGGKYSLKEL